MQYRFAINFGTLMSHSADGKPKKMCANIRSNLCYLICLRHLINYALALPYFRRRVMFVRVDYTNHRFQFIRQVPDYTGTNYCMAQKYLQFFQG